LEPDPEQAFPGYVGGFNQFRHHSRSATPYSWGWLDLQATGRGAGTDLFAGPPPSLDEGRLLRTLSRKVCADLLLCWSTSRSHPSLVCGVVTLREQGRRSHGTPPNCHPG
jgi:hypothetical protein